MAFDWCENLDLARWLQANTMVGVSTECAQRAAIGRAYYAAFGYAQWYAIEYQGYSPRYDSDDHGRLKRHYRAKRYRVSQELDRLRDWRNQCDYDSSAADFTTMLASALDSAQYVLDALSP